MTKFQTNLKKIVNNINYTELAKAHNIGPVGRNFERHQFHLVSNSQLPILMSISSMLVVLSIVFYWHPSNIENVVWLDYVVMHLAFIMFTFTLLSWFIMIVRESQAGHHTAVVQRGLRMGVVLFIVSEVMFFFAFFWAFFHFSLAPSVFIGCVWPPLGIQPLNPWGLPLTNTLLLLSSGITITFAHDAIVKAQTSYHYQAFMKYLASTIVLGFTFLFCQGVEYKYGIVFSWKENVYGSIFFVLTGFHGFHVTFGTLFLLFCLVRAIVSHSNEKIMAPLFFFVSWINNFGSIFSKITNLKKILNYIHDILKKNELAKKIHERFAPKKQKPVVNENSKKSDNKKEKKISSEQNKNNFFILLRTFGFTPKQHIGFEAAAWYWHFVDVVWLFLFVVVYLW